MNSDHSQSPSINGVYIAYTSELNDGSFSESWLLPILILCIIGFALTIAISFLFVCLSFKRFNGLYILTNLLICLGVSLLYIIIIIFLVRGTELLCGLREFLSQFGYVLLFSSFLSRYIMQWLGARILSSRTKQFTAILIYLLFIFIQIPIGILWWYFTMPRSCPISSNDIISLVRPPPLFPLPDEFPFRQRSSVTTTRSSQDYLFPISLSTDHNNKVQRHLYKAHDLAYNKLCSYRCNVDYRFYATYTYTIIQLLLCTIISCCLFCFRNNYNSSVPKTTISSETYHTTTTPLSSKTLNFLTMFTFVLIDLFWLLWTFFYFFAHSYYVFPALVGGMFSIATLCLIFILIPQLYYYAHMKVSSSLYNNKSQSTDTHILEVGDGNGSGQKLNNKSNTKKKQRKNRKLTETTQPIYSADTTDNDDLLQPLSSTQKKSNKSKHGLRIEKLNNNNDSEQSYENEIGTSGTFLPITTTPRGMFKVNDETTINKQKIKHQSENTKIKDENKVETPVEKLDKLIYGDRSAIANETRVHSSLGDVNSKEGTYLNVLNSQLVSTSIPIEVERQPPQQYQQIGHEESLTLQPPIMGLQRQLTSSSIASDFLTPIMYNPVQTLNRPHRLSQVSTSLASTTDYGGNDLRSNVYWPLRQQQSERHDPSSYPVHLRHYDETIIPVSLQEEQRPRTSTPLQMLNRTHHFDNTRPSNIYYSSQPRRAYSGTELSINPWANRRYRPRFHRGQYPPYHHHSPEHSVTNWAQQSRFRPPSSHDKILYVDPYRTVPSRIGGNTWQSVLLNDSSHYPKYDQILHQTENNTDNLNMRQIFSYGGPTDDGRSLSSRLWDIDSESNDDEELPTCLENEKESWKDNSSKIDSLLDFDTNIRTKTKQPFIDDDNDNKSNDYLLKNIARPDSLSNDENDELLKTVDDDMRKPKHHVQV
ncbi:unnamed protein product [Didymodactylos carnosus]|uniref:G-protein coupled receptors family 3 profile domain-containing protein n=1 Tax=Didymodactylos carnosus TaxID=1234261 RepID=A0A814NGW3_9BILA|nr:unnamed protein product [Didymodactylos carnosus]CAF1091791.1 unnamed protein product [Didymodactylos carnosus]CAF3513148.1 unnamed protein product [Didymodactylos carnosus]CAF3857263.1 unnamed protein product [Didymodactylos carnosus]